MGTCIHRAVLLPVRVIGRRSQHRSNLRCSRHRLSADGVQCSTGGRRVRPYAATNILTSWDSNAVGFYIHSGIVDGYIGAEESVQLAIWIHSDFFIWDVSGDDDKCMAVESECC